MISCINNSVIKIIAIIMLLCINRRITAFRYQPYRYYLFTSYPTKTSTQSRYRPSLKFNFQTILYSTFDESINQDDDEKYMIQAIKCAEHGLGQTYPNPAVGCVLVRDDTNEVIGRGFHPRAGFPHAEVFALFEATGLVPSGIEAAKSIVQQFKVSPNNDKDDNTDNSMNDNIVQNLSMRYASSDGSGPKELFENKFQNIPVTAYVTLEPCCHYGKTPPCAASFVLAGVNRVVVGFRDPNPRVDGGGVKFLQDAGVHVDMVPTNKQNQVYAKCSNLVSSFVKRIIPKEYDTKTYDWINGAKRSALRSVANGKKANQELVEVIWGGGEETSIIEQYFSTNNNDDDNEKEIIQNHVQLDPAWMEHLDGLLWEHELVNLRFTKAIPKKRFCKLLGGRIASELGAHVAQTIGHTVLLYRPGIPPVMDLDVLVADQAKLKTK